MNRKELVAAIAAHTGQDTKTVDTSMRGFVDVTSIAFMPGVSFNDEDYDLSVDNVELVGTSGDDQAVGPHVHGNTELNERRRPWDPAGERKLGCGHAGNRRANRGSRSRTGSAEGGRCTAGCGRAGAEEQLL